MPELPEIETLRRSLTFLKGKTIVKVSLSNVAPLEHSRPQDLKKFLADRGVTELSRWGKYLRLHTDGPYDLVLHLGMSGQFRYWEASDTPHPPHTHMELRFADGSCLRYVDPRRFGTLSLTGTPSGEDNPFLAHLGPNYDDPQFTAEVFMERARRHPGLSLKNLTLHQGVAAGLGNIYVCESLYRAGLDPRRLVRKTKDDALARLLDSARHCVAQGIHYGGTTFRDYLDGLGHRGKMKDFLQVYDREGLITLDGRGRVRRITQNARSTFFCPKVQK